MVITKLARAYAKSLLDLAVEQKSADKVLEDLRMINRTIAESVEFEGFIKSPLLHSAKKQEVFQAVFKGKLQELTQKFIDLMIKQGREGRFPEVIEAYKQLYRTEHGILLAKVTTAYELDDKEQKALIKKLEQAFDKKVELETTIDKEIIGGIKLRMGDLQYDGSLSSKIKDLQRDFRINQYIADF